MPLDRDTAVAARETPAGTAGLYETSGSVGRVMGGKRYKTAWCLVQRTAIVLSEPYTG
ncbi:hypothetical protein LJR034_005394 [Caballeronia sp. LjRoot34]|uniref:hypothetical protein n=1 Tax=Caballeronia sp. LjRoot34 TaxID=3342325 RepID=UPI003ECD90E9